MLATTCRQLGQKLGGTLRVRGPSRACSVSFQHRRCAARAGLATGAEAKTAAADRSRQNVTLSRGSLLRMMTKSHLGLHHPSMPWNRAANAKTKKAGASAAVPSSLVPPVVPGMFVDHVLQHEFGSVRNRLLSYGLETVERLLRQRQLEHSVDFEYAYDWRAVDDVDRVVMQLVDELRVQGVNVEQMDVAEFELRARERIVRQLPLELEVDVLSGGRGGFVAETEEEYDTGDAEEPEPDAVPSAAADENTTTSADITSRHASAIGAARTRQVNDFQRTVSALVNQTTVKYEDSLDRQKYKEQLKKECESIQEAEKAYRELVQDLSKFKKASGLDPSTQLIAEWFAPLTAALQDEVAHCLKQTPSMDRRVYAPYLVRLQPSTVAVIALHCAVNACLSTGNEVKLTQLALDIGQALNVEAGVSSFRSDKVSWKRWRQYLDDNPTFNVWNVERFLRRRMDESQLWSSSIRVKVGAAVLEHVLRVCTVKDVNGAELPAFVRSTPSVAHKIIGLISLHPRALTVLEGSQLLSDCIAPQHKPMLIPPRPWTTFMSGGYLSVNSEVMRLKLAPSEQRAALKKVDLSNIFAALNILSQTPWRVNERVLHVVNQSWAAGGGVAGLIAPNLPVPDTSVLDDMEEAERQAFEDSLALTKKTNYERHAIRCQTNLKLGVAREFQHTDFYFPYNVDFRGRVYPIPPHHNHIGDDLSRGLLRFARGKPLGARGLWWLKVQFSNMCGNDKVSFADRVAFADTKLRDIHGVASDPLHPDHTWWMEQEAPWQCLAVCFELSEALSCPNPEMFVSHLPVHQDGSCNGLQHYAALGRDEIGGQSVNLMPSEKPQDVYSAVCDLVSAEVAQDASSPSSPNHELAKLVVGKIHRKVVKQTVMTSVYGVKLIGARRQIEARLAENHTIDWPDLSVRRATALYLAKVTLNSLGNMFNGARSIMTWLADVAGLVASRGHTMNWITPLGLPVVQPYRRESVLAVKTVLQTCTLSRETTDRPVSSNKQKSAFPPNFVHSLDSTHMMLTALDCKTLGIEFASVHDSFWTHAGSVDVMNESLRRQFVLLYSQPILQDLRNSLQLQYPDIDFPPLPQVGALNINNVLKADYFFN